MPASQAGRRRFESVRPLSSQRLASSCGALCFSAPDKDLRLPLFLLSASRPSCRLASVRPGSRHLARQRILSFTQVQRIVESHYHFARNRQEHGIAILARRGHFQPKAAHNSRRRCAVGHRRATGFEPVPFGPGGRRERSRRASVFDTPPAHENDQAPSWERAWSLCCFPRWIHEQSAMRWSLRFRIRHRRRPAPDARSGPDGVRLRTSGGCRGPCTWGPRSEALFRRP